MMVNFHPFYTVHLTLPPELTKGDQGPSPRLPL